MRRPHPGCTSCSHRPLSTDWSNIMASSGPSPREDDDLEQLATQTAALSIRKQPRSRTAAARTPASTLRPTKRCVHGSDEEGSSKEDDTAKDNAQKPATPGPPPKVTPSRLHCIKDLKEEFTCGVCLDILQRPCTTQCGHSFCRSCLREALKHNYACPKCRAVVPAGPLRINTVLWNAVQMLFPQAVAHAVGSVTPETQPAAAQTRHQPAARQAPSASNTYRPQAASGNAALRRPFVPPRRVNAGAVAAAAAPATQAQPSNAPSRIQQLIDQVTHESNRMGAVANSQQPLALSQEPAPLPSQRATATLGASASQASAAAGPSGGGGSGSRAVQTLRSLNPFARVPPAPAATQQAASGLLPVTSNDARPGPLASLEAFRAGRPAGGERGMWDGAGVRPYRARVSSNRASQAAAPAAGAPAPALSAGSGAPAEHMPAAAARPAVAAGANAAAAGPGRSGTWTGMVPPPFRSRIRGTGANQVAAPAAAAAAPPARPTYVTLADDSDEDIISQLWGAEARGAAAAFRQNHDAAQARDQRGPSQAQAAPAPRTSLFSGWRTQGARAGEGPGMRFNEVTMRWEAPGEHEAAGHVLHEYEVVSPPRAPAQAQAWSPMPVATPATPMLFDGPDSPVAPVFGPAQGSPVGLFDIPASQGLFWPAPNPAPRGSRPQLQQPAAPGAAAARVAQGSADQPIVISDDSDSEGGGEEGPRNNGDWVDPLIATALGAMGANYPGFRPASELARQQ